MFKYVGNDSAISRRRNAIKPDDVEYIISNRPGSDSKPDYRSSQRSSSEWRVSPPRKRPRSNEDCFTTLNTRPRSFSELSGPEGMTPVVMQRSETQRTLDFDYEHPSFLDSHSTNSAQERPARKRKVATLSDEEEYYDLQPALFDVIHPSEIRLNDEDVDGESIELVHDSFPKQVYPPQTHRSPVRADDCCDKGRGYKVNPNNGQIIIQSKTQTATSTTSSSSTSSSAAPATTTSSATTATAGAAETGANALPSPVPASDGLSGGAKAGIAIGAVAGVAIIAGLAFLLFRERRKRKALAESEKQPLPAYDNGYYSSVSSPAVQSHHQPPMAPTELGAYGRNENKYHYHSELGDGQGRPSELHP
ncbi:MAG: hypothetical protein Q9226_004071 [Calogaya cf. arnoldii]